MIDSSKPPFAAPSRGHASEVLLAFLRLGCHSFGGPIAHLGYFHTEFVERRQWCGEDTFAEVVALAQSMLETKPNSGGGDGKKRFIEFFSVVPGRRRPCGNKRNRSARPLGAAAPSPR